MLLLVAGVQLGIVWLLVTEHTEEDFKQSLPQAPEGASVGHSLLAFLVVVGLAPSAGLAETVGPQMDGGAQELIAGPAHPHFVQLA